MTDVSNVRVSETVTVLQPISWRAVLAGVVVALVVQLLLALLGTAIGLAFVNPTNADGSAVTTGAVVAAIWWTLSGILAAWIGGLTAGRLSSAPGTEASAWHGLVTWAVTILVVFFLFATAVGGVIGGAFTLLGGVVNTAAQATATAAPQIAAAADPFGEIEPSLQDAIGVRDPESARNAIAGLVRSALTADEAESQQATDRAVDALSRATGQTPDQARQTISDWKARYDQAVGTAQQRAVEAADAARKTASSAGIIAVIALVFGALAGWFGGLHSGTPGRSRFFGVGSMQP